MVVLKEEEGSKHVSRGSSGLGSWNQGLTAAQQMYVLKEAGFEKALHDSSVEVDIPSDEMKRLQWESKNAERRLKKLK